MCVFDDFPDIRGGDQQLALMPISRLTLDEPLEVQGSIIYPAGAIDLGELRVRFSRLRIFLRRISAPCAHVVA